MPILAVEDAPPAPSAEAGAAAKAMGAVGSAADDGPTVPATPAARRGSTAPEAVVPVSAEDVTLKLSKKGQFSEPWDAAASDGAALRADLRLSGSEPEVSRRSEPMAATVPDTPAARAARASQPSQPAAVLVDGGTRPAMDTIPGVGMAEDAPVSSAERGSRQDSAVPVTAATGAPDNGPAPAQVGGASASTQNSSAVAAHPALFADAPWWPKNEGTRRRPLMAMVIASFLLVAIALIGLSRTRDAEAPVRAAASAPAASSNPSEGTKTVPNASPPAAAAASVPATLSSAIGAVAAAGTPPPMQGKTDDPPTPAASAAEGGEETVSVRITIHPKGTKLFADGKELGKAPLTVSVRRGESQVFEARARGYYPKKVTVDTSHAEQVVWMIPTPSKAGAKEGE